MNPQAKNNEITINQITSQVKALKAAVKLRVFFTTEEVKLIKPHVPTSNGLRTRPAMVDRKIKSNCHA
ncbi:hypothetical protein SESBI_12616 [Sesbania bispinosa]|nr:hypothetical protein SESBI_12616 [Sesbania bispinosa]